MLTNSIYLFTDSILIMMYYKEIGDIFYVLHHLASAYAYYYVIVCTWCFYSHFKKRSIIYIPLIDADWLTCPLLSKTLSMSICMCIYNGVKSISSPLTQYGGIWKVTCQVDVLSVVSTSLEVDIFSAGDSLDTFILNTVHWD